MNCILVWFLVFMVKTCKAISSAFNIYGADSHLNFSMLWSCKILLSYFILTYFYFNAFFQTFSFKPYFFKLF